MRNLYTKKNELNTATLQQLSHRASGERFSSTLIRGSADVSRPMRSSKLRLLLPSN